MAAPIITITDRSPIEDLQHPLRKRFLFFRANYYHFFGPPPGGDYWAVFKNYLEYKARAPEQYGVENMTRAINNCRIIDDHGSFALASRQAVMVSSFHYGAYNLLAGLLVNEGIRFAVLANSAQYYKQMRAFHQNMEGTKNPEEFTPALNDSDIIDPRDFTTMIKMMHKVRAGKSLLVYADGLEGQGGYFAREKLARVPFLGKEIYARKGTASLAYTLKIPIVFAMVEHDGAEVAVRSFPVLDPADYASKDDFTEAYCHLGYRYLEDYVRNAPEQWEIFDRLHVWLPEPAHEHSLPETPPQAWQPPSCCRFDHERFSEFGDEGKWYLLDRDRREVITISAGLAKLLPRINGVAGEVVSEVIPPQLLWDMFRRGVIVADPLTTQERTTA